ncbi:MAG TPA: hypothetical protein VKQ54_11185 [Caulobacteraceae bacterium]|nr:hypothetical protein [Caulobacteraceae bacterium]
MDVAFEGLAKGWTVRGGVVSPGDLVADYAAREQGVQGVCRGRGCSRRLDLEPKALSAIGLGLLSMTVVKKMWQCQRPDGCRLDYHDTAPEAPLRLAQFVGRPNVRVRLRCRASPCKFHRVWRVEEMIAALRKRGQGGEATAVDKLGAMMTSPCPLCKKAAWTAEALWVDTGSVGWKVNGERAFEAIESGETLT